MHILVANDDGIFAPGILALHAALRMIEGAKVTVVAPDQDQSGVGHRKTYREPLRISPVSLPGGGEGYACSGSPADGVALALAGYIEEPVDIVVSGINSGANIAHHLTYSGTVGAAMEAALFGLPAIAISLAAHRDVDYGHAAAFAKHITPLVLEKGMPDRTLLNVNVPAGMPKGVLVTRQGRRLYRPSMDERRDPYGLPYYWSNGSDPFGDMPEIGTDAWAVAEGYISVTPIRLEMTDSSFMRTVEEWELMPEEYYVDLVVEP